MNIEQIHEYTLSLPGVTEDQPFGDDILTFRLEGKIFVCLWLGGGQYHMKDSEPRIALKLITAFSLLVFHFPLRGTRYQQKKPAFRRAFLSE